MDGVLVRNKKPTGPERTTVLTQAATLRDGTLLNGIVLVSVVGCLVAVLFNYHKIMILFQDLILLNFPVAPFFRDPFEDFLHPVYVLL